MFSGIMGKIISPEKMIDTAINMALPRHKEIADSLIRNINEWLTEIELLEGETSATLLVRTTPDGGCYIQRITWTNAQVSRLIDTYALHYAALPEFQELAAKIKHPLELLTLLKVK